MPSQRASPAQAPIEQTSAGSESLMADLDTVEQLVGKLVEVAGQCLTELGKEKPSLKQVDLNANDFINTTKDIERRLLGQISYLSQVGVGSAHEGNAYRSMRRCRSAENQLDYFHEKLQRRTFTGQP